MNQGETEVPSLRYCTNEFTNPVKSRYFSGETNNGRLLNLAAQKSEASFDFSLCADVFSHEASCRNFVMAFRVLCRRENLYGIVVQCVL